MDLYITERFDIFVRMRFIVDLYITERFAIFVRIEIYSGFIHNRKV